MRQVRLHLHRWQKIYGWSWVYLFGIALVLMGQNVIRYAKHSSYDPSGMLRLLGFGFLTFFACVPILIIGAQALAQRLPRHYQWGAIGLIIGTLAVFYLCTDSLQYLLGIQEHFFSNTYLRFFFGRAILFQTALAVAICYQLRPVPQPTPLPTITGMNGRKKVSLQTHRVYWVEVDDHYLKIHYEGGQLLKRATLDQLTAELEPEFVRVHRKYLVNRQYIIGTERAGRDTYLLLRNGARVKVGRSFSSKVLD